MNSISEYSNYKRTQKVIIMLKLIMEHGIINSIELSKALNCTERQIYKYVKDLKVCGIDVKSKTGQQGGYYIDDWKCPICNSKVIGGGGY